jgi:hypothetical protein
LTYKDYVGVCGGLSHFSTTAACFELLELADRVTSLLVDAGVCRDVDKSR